jgi:hypothetical protein
MQAHQVDFALPWNHAEDKRNSLAHQVGSTMHIAYHPLTKQVAIWEDLPYHASKDKVARTDLDHQVGFSVPWNHAEDARTSLGHQVGSVMHNILRSSR